MISLQNGMKLSATIASDSDLLQVEHMIHREALAGNGFGLDEFNKDGTYSRKSLYVSCTIVAKDSNDECVGAMLIGKPTLCRSKKSPMLGVYLVLPVNMQCTNLGMMMYDLAIKLVHHHQYQGLITDIFSCNHRLIEIASGTGFKITGSVPNSAYIKDVGHCDSVLMCYKRVNLFTTVKDANRSKI